MFKICVFKKRLKNGLEIFLNSKSNRNCFEFFKVSKKVFF